MEPSRYEFSSTSKPQFHKKRLSDDEDDKGQIN